MNYGKIAYLKTQDLSRRLSSVSVKKSNDENVLHLRSENIVFPSETLKSVTFNSPSEQYLTLEIEVRGKSGVGMTCPVDYYFNGTKMGSQRVNFTFYAYTPILYTAYMKAAAGENTVSVMLTHSNTVSGVFAVTVRGVSLSAYSDPLVDYYGLEKYFCVFKNNALTLHASYLTNTPYTYDLESLNIDKLRFYKNDNSKIFCITDGNLYLKNFSNFVISGGTPIAGENVTDFCFTSYYNTLFTVKGGSLHKQIFNISSPARNDSVSVELAETQRVNSIFLASYSSNVYLFAATSTAVFLYRYDGILRYLSQAAITNPADVRANSSALYLLSLSEGYAKETTFTLSDITNPSTVDLYSNLDAVCYLSDTQYFAMQGGKLITF